MKKTNVFKNVGRVMSRTKFKLSKHSPEICMVIGIAGTVVSTVLACKATIKAETILDETRTKMDKIHEVAEKADEETYSEEDLKADTVKVYGQTCIALAKIYAPSVVLGAISITSIVTGHKILKGRNIALGAAYAAVDKGFKEYRSRVIEKFGDSVDKELKYNLQSKTFEKTVIDEKTGKEKVITEEVMIADPNEYSPFARFFDDGCIGWSKSPEYNLAFLRTQQSVANDRLKAVGYLYLNEVYEMLGIPRTKEGQVIGWVYDEDNPCGDNFVDFGIYNAAREKNRDFVNGYERSVLLDFNVDGNILDLM